MAPMGVFSQHKSRFGCSTEASTIAPPKYCKAAIRSKWKIGDAIAWDADPICSINGMLGLHNVNIIPSVVVILSALVLYLESAQLTTSKP
jgi:hypothetical protein